MTDAQYRSWIQTLPSALDGKSFSEWLPELGEWRNPACHVRRAGESGTGYKAEFSVIPLTHIQHDYQHRYGELACLAKFCRDPEFVGKLKVLSAAGAEQMAKDWFTEQKAKYYARWLNETPEGRAWAKKHEVEVMA
jgi:hypothetical protein